MQVWGIHICLSNYCTIYIIIVVGLLLYVTQQLVYKYIHIIIQISYVITLTEMTRLIVYECMILWAISNAPRGSLLDLQQAVNCSNWLEEEVGPVQNIL